MFIKHKRQSIRLNNYDYGNNGLYFITICTYNKNNYFGKIINNKMILNRCGLICKNEILKTEKLRNEIKIHEYIIMPNHVHFIIEINKNNVSLNCNNTVGAHCNAPLQLKHKYKNKFGPQINNLASIIRGFKSACTSNINKIQPQYFKWQRNYYEHIIRNENIYLKIKNYIIKNPEIWFRDRNNKYK